MKKRGLKRYYRNLFKKNFAEKIIAELKSGNAEYDYEHIHLDGYPLTKWAEIKQHLDVLFSQLDTFRLNAETISSPFQVWGYICLQRNYGCQIAMYVHTPNNDFDDFPRTFTDVSETPTLNRKEWIDYLKAKGTSGYEIRYTQNCDNEPEIIIALKNTGTPIFYDKNIKIPLYIIRCHNRQTERACFPTMLCSVSIFFVSCFSAVSCSCGGAVQRQKSFLLYAIIL